MWRNLKEWCFFCKGYVWGLVLFKIVIIFVFSLIFCFFVGDFIKILVIFIEVFVFICCKFFWWFGSLGFNIICKLVRYELLLIFIKVNFFNFCLVCIYFWIVILVLGWLFFSIFVICCFVIYLIFFIKFIILINFWIVLYK